MCYTLCYTHNNQWLYNFPNDIYWDRAWTFAFAQCYYNEIFHFSQERMTDKTKKFAVKITLIIG